MKLLPQALQKPFAGILFDLDGTIIDSEQLHYDAFTQALSEFGYDIDTIGGAIAYGGSFRRMFEAIAAKFQLADDLFEEIYQRKVAITIEQSSQQPELIDGVLSFLELMVERQIPMGVVTNSEAAYVEHILHRFDLQSYFQHVVHADLVTNLKPAPDGYRYGTKLLDLPASEILVFENTDGGIAAAKAADLTVVAIHSTDRFGVSTYQAADLTVDHFGDPNIDDLTWHGRNGD